MTTPVFNPAACQYGSWPVVPKNFQTFWGLTVDGIVGPQTWPLIDWASRGFPT